MKLKKIIIATGISALALSACKTEDYQWIKTGVERAQHQLMLTASELEGTGKLPRSIWVGYDFAKLQEQLEKEILVDSLRPQPTAEKLGKRRVCDIYDWTSGFFPGSLWYIWKVCFRKENRKNNIFRIILRMFMSITILEHG